MAGMKKIEIKLEGMDDLALITSNDEVWLVVPLKWYDLAMWLWWWLTPATKRAKIKLNLTDGKKVSVKAVRVASKHVRISWTPK